jgi:hypothetical protein
MSNPHDIYLEHSRRVASLLAWIDAEMEVFDRQATSPTNAQPIWPMVETAARVEELLKAVLAFLSGMSEQSIDEALNDGGQGDE